jgi:hypothetical protein
MSKTVCDAPGRFGTAKQAALDFVGNLSTLDRASIIAFSDNVEIRQTMTGDKTALTAAINSMYCSGGKTKLINAVYTGAKQLVNEANTRAVIVFSDGQENASDSAISAAIKFAKQNNISVYSIATNPEVFRDVDTLKQFADSTGGYFTYAQSVAELSRLYVQIQKDVESRYLLCYRSPDTIFDGGTHVVKVGIQTNGKTASDISSWIERRPPTVEVLDTAALFANHSPSTAVQIRAKVTLFKGDTIQSVRLYYRQTCTTATLYKDTAMYLSGRIADTCIYVLALPGVRMVKPGIDFYIIAIDKFKLLGKARNVLNPEFQPYYIPVDNDAPKLFHTPVTCWRMATSVPIEAKVTDSDGVLSAILFYRKSTEGVFTAETMKADTGHIYRATIPASMVTESNIDYYLWATDIYGASTRNPNTWNYVIIINKKPVLHVPPDDTIQAGDTLNLRVWATDAESTPVLAFVNSASYSWITYTDSGKGVGRVILSRKNWKAGVFPFFFSASDGIDTVSDTFFLTINGVNRPPVIDSVYDRTVKEGHLLSFTVKAIDPDGTVPTLAAAGLPEGAHFDTAAGAGVFNWTPGCCNAGRHTIKFSASDGIATTDTSMVIAVIDSNCFRPEIFVSWKDTSVLPMTPLLLTMRAMDGDCTKPRLRAVSLPQGSVFSAPPDSGKASFSWTPGGFGVTSIKFMAYDQVDSTVFAETTVTIRVLGYNITAFLADTNGEGHIDRIDCVWPPDCELLPVLPEIGNAIDSLSIISLSGQRKQLAPWKMVRIDKSTLRIILRENADADLETGWNEANVVLSKEIFTASGYLSVVSQVVDKAGPVIQSARFFPACAANGNREAIKVVMSEQVWVSQTAASQEIINYFIGGSPQPSGGAFEGTSAAQRTVEGRTIIIPVAPGFRVVPFKDSLNAAACGSSKALTDSAVGNCPYPANRRVPVGFEGSVPAAAVLYDGNGEGHLDEIAITWALPFALDTTEPLPKFPFDSLAVVPYGDAARLMLFASDKIRVGQRSLNCELVEIKGAPPQTGWKEAMVSINNQIRVREGFPFVVDSIIDSAGPVLKSAQLHPFTGADKRGGDTLVVDFAEPLRIPKARAFAPADILLLFRKGSTTPDKAAFLGLDSMGLRFVGADSCVQASFVLSPSLIVSPERDSVSLRRHEDSLMRVRDVSQAHNTPHPNSRRVPITLFKGGAVFAADPIENAFACENPFTPGSSRLPPSPCVQSQGPVSSTGTRIEVGLKNGVYAEETGAVGSVEIFDIVGNLIVNSKPMAGCARSLYYYWNGRNDRGMIVSQGLYLARIKVAIAASSVVYSRNVKIGVKHN